MNACDLYVNACMQTKFPNFLKSKFYWTDWSLDLVVVLVEKQSIAKVNRIHPLGIMNFFTKRNGNPSGRYLSAD